MYFQYKDEKYSPRFAVGGYMHIELTAVHSGTMHARSAPLTLFVMVVLPRIQFA